METRQMLLARLLDLAHEVQQSIDDFISTGKIARTEQTLYVLKVNDFEYDQGRAAITQLPTAEKRVMWDPLQVREIAQSLPSLCKHYHPCISVMAQLPEFTHERALAHVNQYVELIVGVIGRNQSFSDDDFILLTEKFIKDLFQEPVEWKVKVFLLGVWPQVEQLELMPGVVLRYPRVEDFEGASLLTFPPKQLEPFENISSILSLNCISSSGGENQRLADKLIHALRLFHLGSVASHHDETFPVSLLRGGWISSPKTTEEVYKYQFMAEDVVVFGRFWESIKDYLSALKKLDSPLGIAYSRFETALFERNMESVITSAIMCLEALYLKGSENELSHRLGQRVACLLGAAKLGYTLELYNQVKKAYGIRSSFVHGNIQRSKDRAIAGELGKRIMEIARLSLAIFLVLKIDKNMKEEVVNRIDNALLDASELESLERFLEPVTDLVSTEIG